MQPLLPQGPRRCGTCSGCVEDGRRADSTVNVRGDLLNVLQKGSKLRAIYLVGIVVR
jgi:hypothetical protein